MLKQKIDTAALFAQKKTEVQSSARTLLILDGQENAYISADELTEELLAIPEEGAIWLDMSLFGSHDQVMTVARSFKLSPATQNILENKKQQPRLFRDGNNRILICRHLQLNEGKSTTISNLAVVMAQAGHKVLLMDCDMRNPTQHKLFKLTNKGLSNCISASEEVREVIQKTGIENLELLASGPVAPNPSELLGSKRMEQLLEQLKPDYDYILIDTPPIMPVTDAAVLSGKVDGLVMLVSSGEVTPAAAKEAKQRLLQAGAHILGVILNKVELAHTHGYGYYYYYGSDSTSGGDIRR